MTPIHGRRARLVTSSKQARTRRRPVGVLTFDHRFVTPDEAVKIAADFGRRVARRRGGKPEAKHAPRSRRAHLMLRRVWSHRRPRITVVTPTILSAEQIARATGWNLRGRWNLLGRG